MSDKSPRAHFDETSTAVVIERLTVRDKDVAREAQRWTTGERGPTVDDPTALAAADLAGFVTEADTASRKAFSQSVADAKTDLNTELRRVFGGENPSWWSSCSPSSSMIPTSCGHASDAGACLGRASGLN